MRVTNPELRFGIEEETEVNLRPRLPDPLKAFPDFGQQEKRHCVRFVWYRQVPRMFCFLSGNAINPFWPLIEGGVK